MDPRMTEETKQIALKREGFAGLFNDTVAANKMLDSAAEESNKKYKFDDIVEKEFLVDSLHDESHKIPITAYIPKTAKPTAPIVVFIHGGGFQLMSRKCYRNSVSYIADHSNTIWISVEYRLAPEHKYPVQIQDCLSVTKWVLDNKIKEFNAANEAKVGVCGDSAGGTLAAAVALQSRHTLSFQILVYPPLDLTCASLDVEFAKPPFFLPLNFMMEVTSVYAGNDSLKTTPGVSPLFDNVAEAPKCLLISGDLDPHIGDVKCYQKKLEDASVNNEVCIIQGAIHGFFSNMEYKSAFFECTLKILKFLNRV